jgi:putative transposase
MAEASIKTIKRDYVWFGDLKDALTVMGQLADCFVDYNENAPHNGLKMKSPRQFLQENELAKWTGFTGANPCLKLNKLYIPR